MPIFRICVLSAFIAASTAILVAQQTDSSTVKSGVDLSAIDKSVDPCQNFYRYACGSWIKNNPVPPQYSRWGRFNELAERNQEISRQILEDSAKNQDRSPLDQKIGAFYSACMDEAAIEKAGAAPVEPTIKTIEGISDKTALAREIAQLQREGANAFFRFGVSPDFENSRVTIADADQGGLGLPDKSYYEDPKDDAIRQKYLQHISKMFQLLGVPPSEAESRAKAVLSIETALAAASLDRVARRNPHLTHHKLTLAEFEQLTPSLDLKAYLAALHAPAFSSMNVAVPDFFKSLSTVIDKTNLDDLKSYLAWHYVSAYASTLSKPFVEENFDFYSRTLTGAKELQPRWKRCVQSADRELGTLSARNMSSELLPASQRRKPANLSASSKSRWPLTSIRLPGWAMPPNSKPWLS